MIQLSHSIVKFYPSITNQFILLHIYEQPCKEYCLSPFDVACCIWCCLYCVLITLGHTSMNAVSVTTNMGQDMQSTVMKNHDVSRKTKVMLVKSLVFPVMLYGAESWTLKLNDKRRINAFELYCRTQL